MPDPDTSAMLTLVLLMAVEVIGIAVAAILLGGGSDSPCNGDEPTPEPGGC